MPGYTRIEDLPELGPDEANAFREEYKPRDVQKFIRNNRLIIPSGAGMNNIQEAYNQPQHNPQQQQYHSSHNPQQYHSSHNPQQQYHSSHNPQQQQQYNPQQYHPSQNSENPPQTHEGYNNHSRKTREEYSDEEFIEPQIIKLRGERHNLIDPMSVSCIDISCHIQNCPICSKFYNGDKSLYIIIIIILAIVSLLLLKRVLGV
jgi:hypothetical protein